MYLQSYFLMNQQYMARAAADNHRDVRINHNGRSREMSAADVLWMLAAASLVTISLFLALCQQWIHLFLLCLLIGLALILHKNWSKIRTAASHVRRWFTEKNINCILCRRSSETREPTRFRFVENLNPRDVYTFKHNGSVVVRCEESRGFWRLVRKLTPFPELGMWRLRNTMLDSFGTNGTPNLRIPDDVVSIAIPRDNFRVKGEFSNEFEPKDGVQGEYSYELYSSSVQVTWFHYDNHKYMAGVVIYMANRYNPFLIHKDSVKRALDDRRIYRPNPANFKEKLMRKTWCSVRNEWIIMTRNESGEVEKFVFNGQENQMESVKCSDCSFELSAQLNGCSQMNARLLPNRDFAKFLKLEFCEKWNDLVMIGKDSTGKIAHFNWDSNIGKFNVQSCSECDQKVRAKFEVVHGEEEEDAPPSYEFLESVDLNSRNSVHY